jgi:hypothetical protein
MSVVFKEEVGAGRTATNDKGVRRYSRQFLLETTARTDGPYAVGSDSSLPRIGTVHNEDATAYCVNLTVNNVKPWKWWIVTADYSSEREITENPLSEPAAITWTSEQFQKRAVLDRVGNGIVNSAGDPFDPPLMMDDSRRVVTISKNLAVVPAWILTYQDAVNSSSFIVDGITVGAGFAKVQSVTVGETQRRNGTAFRVVTLVMHLQKTGWALTHEDVGFREIGDGTGYGDRQNILNDGDDERPTAPVALDGAGNHQASPTASTIEVLSFDVYEQKDFTVLPLS